MPQQIIVDENVPESVAKYLETRGFKVHRVSEDFLKSAKDSVIAQYTAKKGMHVLTLDSDFAKLYHNLFRGKITVLLVKANPPKAENIISILDSALDTMRKTDIQNKLLIITKKRIRIIS